MARADVETLASDLSNGQSNASEITRIYDDVVFDLAGRDALVQVALIASVAGTAVYTLVAAATKFLAVFFDDKQLSPSNYKELEAIYPDWRDRQGQPEVYILEGESKLSFRLFPTPDLSSGSVAAGDLGTGFVRNAITVIYLEDRANLPTYLELPTALEIVGRELAQESDHIDLNASGVFLQLSQLLFSMVL